MTKAVKNVTERNGNLGVVKDASGFGFGGTCYDMAECFALYQDGGSDRCGIGGSKREVAGDATAGFGGNEVCRVGVHLKDHIVGNKPEAASRVSSSIIQEPVAEIEGFCRGFGLLG